MSNIKRVGTGIVVILVVSLFSGVSAASVVHSFDKMEDLSGEFYRHIKNEEWLEAREKLWKLSVQFSQHNWEKADVSVEGIHVLSGTLVGAKRALARAELNPEEIYVLAIQTRLGIDALQHREQPLWHRYYRVLQNDIRHLKDTIPSGNQEAVQSAVDRLQSHFELIRPALYVTRSPQVVEQVQSMFAFMNKQIHDVSLNREALSHVVDKWERLLDPLFYGSDQDVLAIGSATEPPIFVVAWWLAFVISIVLVYVAWKKAQGEQVRRSV